MNQLENICQKLAERVAHLALEPRKRVVQLKREKRLCKDGKMRAIPKRHTPEELNDRFLAFIRLDGIGDCWRWTGCKKDGYGQMRDADGKLWYAHRYMYQNFVGEIGDFHVLHDCDNPECTRPEHLYLGLDKENRRDMANRNRAKGLHMTHSREVIQKVVLDSENLGATAISRKHGVNRCTVNEILKRPNYYLTYAKPESVQ